MQVPFNSEADLFILGVDNTSVRRQQTRVAAECQRLGLSVHVLVEDLSAPADMTAAAYRADGFDVTVIPAHTWRSGPLGFPSAVAQLRLLYSWRRVLLRAKPKVVLTHADSDGTWRVLQVWARGRGVVGAVLQEGVTGIPRPGITPGPRNPVRRMVSRIVRATGPRVLELMPGNYLYADHALVWGRAMRQRLLGAGREASTIHVVGNPGFDDVTARRPLAPGDRRTVLFAHQHQPNAAVEFEACRHLIRVCADDLRCGLLVRPHPRGDLRRDTIETLAAQTSAPDLIRVVDAGEIADYFDQASVFATYYSTTAYDAALRGLPIVLLDWVSLAWGLDAPVFGAALSVREPADLKAALSRALDDPEFRQSLYLGGEGWLHQHVGSLDGGAARRAADVVAGLCRGMPSPAS